MDTRPQYIRDNIPKGFYVYIYHRPDNSLAGDKKGTPFYVGKGSRYKAHEFNRPYNSYFTNSEE